MDAQFAADAFCRSAESGAFEEFWRTLCGENLMPSRKDFQPKKALRFLGDIVLTEAPTEQSPTLRIRVTGQRVDNLVGANLTGKDNLDLMPEQYRAGAIASARKMVEQPCGLWQISPAHLLRGYATNIELTAFPLSPDEDGKAYILSHILPAGGLGSVSIPTDRGIGIDSAVTYRYIDIGAGVPLPTVPAS
jgi:hypothetical protein